MDIDRTPVDYNNFVKSFMQFKNGLENVSLDISEQDRIVFMKLFKRLDITTTSSYTPQ